MATSPKRSLHKSKPRRFLPLRTKLHPPIPATFVMHRQQLTKILDDSHKTHKHVFIVTAPPGYGKTTLVADWLSTSDDPYAWLTIDKNDNDPSVLIRYIGEALKGVGLEARNIDYLLNMIDKDKIK